MPRTDNSGMNHRTRAALVDDTCPVVAVERRRAPDRRTRWRGGRRDRDWLNRPLGALARLARRDRPLFAWRSWLSARQP